MGKLQLVHDYNKCIGGVYRNDEFFNCYFCVRESNKWTKKGRDMSRNARNNKNGKKDNIMANLANMAKMTILPESPTGQSTKQ